MNTEADIRVLTSDEVDSTSGGVRRWLLGNLLWEGLQQGVEWAVEWGADGGSEGAWQTAKIG